jgi:hypothetical protein
MVIDIVLKSKMTNLYKPNHYIFGHKITHIAASIMHLAVIDRRIVGGIQRVRVPAARVRLEGYQLFVYQSHLEGMRQQPSVVLLGFRELSEAAFVVHVIVHHCELAGKGSQDI